MTCMCLYLMCEACSGNQDQVEISSDHNFAQTQKQVLYQHNYNRLMCR